MLKQMENKIESTIGGLGLFRVSRLGAAFRAHIRFRIIGFAEVRCVDSGLTGGFKFKSWVKALRGL